MVFEDREDAGRRLAERLVHLRGESPVVLGLPRGGVVVADAVALALDAPLDVWVVRKVGTPWWPELGLGAVAEGGLVLLDHQTMRQLGVNEREVAMVVERESKEVEDRIRRFRQGRPPPAVGGRTVILVDDGVATGGTAGVSLRALRRREPRRLVLAVPVAAVGAVERLRQVADEVVCLETPVDFGAVSQYYDDFTATSDAEVVDRLQRSWAAVARSTS